MRFDLKAYREAEGVVSLSFDAADGAEARRQAEGQGYTVLSARGGEGLLGGALPGGKRFSVMLFCQELVALLEAGMGLVESLDILCRKARQPETRRILEDVRRAVGEGRAFSQALEATPGSFPVLFVATVRTSERTGDLAEALRRYLEYQHRLNAVRDKMVAASVYPALLIVIGALVVAFLFMYVVPRFARIYEDVGRGHLPLLSRWLMNWGQLMGEHAWAISGTALMVLAGLVYFLRRPATRAALEQRLWRLPALGEYLRIYQLARFTRTVAMLLKGGIPLVTALDMTGDLLRQPALRSGLETARRVIREGRPVSDTFAAQGLATEVGARLLVVGERSGELGEVMERIAAFYDEEIARGVEWFSRLFEPLLMIAIGLVIGGIVILMYLPIFELAGSIQ